MSEQLPAAGSSAPPRATLPEHVRLALNVRPEHAPILAEACGVFGINPDPELQPRELAGHRIEGSAEEFVLPYASIVTCGGLKLRYPMDERTEHWLRYNVFKAFRKDKRTGEITELPLPRDLRLPSHHKTGIVPAQ